MARHTRTSPSAVRTTLLQKPSRTCSADCAGRLASAPTSTIRPAALAWSLVSWGKAHTYFQPPSAASAPLSLVDAAVESAVCSLAYDLRDEDIRVHAVSRRL